MRLHRVIRQGFTKLVLVAGAAWGLGNCSTPQPKTEGLFSRLTPHPELQDILSVRPVSKDAYEFKFEFWKQSFNGEAFVPDYALHGKLKAVNQCLRFETESIVDHYVLFDFALKNKFSRRISIVQKINQGGPETTVKHEHLLMLDTCFFDAALSDSVFKFRLSHVLRNESDLVFFVGKHSGPQGVYHGRLFMNERAVAEEEIYSWRGNIYEQRLPHRNVRILREDSGLKEKF